MSGNEEGHPFSFYLPDLAARTTGEIVLLDEEESRHVRSVRLTDGSPIVVTDGLGALRAAELGGLQGRRREVVLGGMLPPPPSLPVELAVAVGNRNRMLWLIEKATEFGVERLTLLETERSRSVSDAGRSEGFRDKASRRALSALKQSQGARLPSISRVEELTDFLSRTRSREGSEGFVLDRDGPPLLTLLAEPDDPVALIVGPEGGLSGDELDECERSGFRRARLAAPVLRFETAAVAAVALVAQHAEAHPARGTGASDRGRTQLRHTSEGESE